MEHIAGLLSNGTPFKRRTEIEICVLESRMRHSADSKEKIQNVSCRTDASTLKAQAGVVVDCLVPEVTSHS